MLTVNKLVVASIFLFFLGGVALPESSETPPQAPNVKTQQQPDGAAKSQSKADNQTQAAEPIKPVENQRATENTKRHADNEAEKRAEEASEYGVFFGRRLKITDALLTLFTLLLVIVGIGQGIFLYRTDQGTHKAANAAEDAAKVAKDTLVAANRPWISVSVEPAGPITWNDGGLQVRYKIILKNIGKSPALNVTHIEAISFEGDTALVEQQRNMPKAVAAAQLFGVANIMPDDFREMIIQEQVDRETIEKYAASWTAAGGGPKLIMPVLLGTADYTTQFDSIKRHSGFIYSVGFWDPAKGIIVTALDPASDGAIPAERVRILRHHRVDGAVD
jgi:hypothetical protein